MANRIVPMGYRVSGCKEVCNVVGRCPVYRALKDALDSVSASYTENSGDFVEFICNTTNSLIPNTVELRASYRYPDPHRRTDIYFTKKLGNSTIDEEEHNRVCEIVLFVNENTWKINDFDGFADQLRSVLKEETDKLEANGK